MNKNYEFNWIKFRMPPKKDKKKKKGDKESKKGESKGEDGDKAWYDISIL